MGPTAIGKTATAIAIAKAIDAEIINVDSGQVYRSMSIGTAKPTLSEREQVPHHLVDIVEPEDPYSAARFCSDALSSIQSIRERGRTPLLVGGTMLYFKSLEQGLAKLPAANAEVRAELRDEAKAAGWPAMHEKLKAIDPVAAARIHPNDPQRTQRALEVFRLTFESFVEQGIAASRQLAKRQMTWVRGMENVHKIPCDDNQNPRTHTATVKAQLDTLKALDVKP